MFLSNLRKDRVDKSILRHRHTPSCALLTQAVVFCAGSLFNTASSTSIAAAGIRVPRKVERDVMLLVNDRDPQINLYTTANLGTEESGRCEEVAVMGR